jgi:hypothetical protein
MAAFYARFRYTRVLALLFRRFWPRASAENTAKSVVAGALASSRPRPSAASAYGSPIEGTTHLGLVFADFWFSRATSASGCEGGRGHGEGTAKSGGGDASDDGTCEPAEGKNRTARSASRVRLINGLNQGAVVSPNSSARLSSVRTTSPDITASDPVVDQIRDLIGVTDPIRIVDPADFPTLPSIATKVAFRLTLRTADGNQTLDPVIYIVSRSWAYQQAKSGSSNAVYLLASSVVHEIAHGHGATERAALSAQRDLLVKLTALPIRTEKLMFLRDQVRQIEKKIEVENIRPTIHEAYVITFVPPH